MDQAATLISSLLMLFFVVLFARSATCHELDVKEYIARYRARDLAHNNGTGNSTYTNSSSLAWGESYILANYIMLYRVTGDVYWLEKVTQHFDQMIYGMKQDRPRTEFREFSAAEVDVLANEMIQSIQDFDFSRHDSDGHPLWNTEYPGWYTDQYSVAHVRVVDTNSETARLIPIEEIISNIERAHQVTGREYQIQFDDDKHYTIMDLAESIELGESITEIPGASLRVEGVPKAGDTFTVKTIEPKPLQYIVHDGMVLYPIAQFIEIVLNDDELHDQFRKKAEIYIRLIKDVFVTKWERYWTDLDNDAGAYRFTESPSERAPDRLLPHNQYNALCHAYLVLQDGNLTDDPALREKATRMVRYFKSNLRPTGDAWTWNYWDWGAGEDEHSSPEDSSHASINVGTAIEAYHRSIGFDRQDMVRFAHTLLDQMWNGSLENPGIGDRVDSNKGDRYFRGRSWVELCEFDPKVWDVCLAWFKSKGEPTDLIPSMLHAQKITGRKL